ncbi:MAG TPA: hypothetical protein VKX28_13130 [Xanthobacteraceae bacterium]|nr:hypothetical protein [Xanthobacteraceae bacterium]
MSLVDHPVAPAREGAWNPGLESELPRELLPLATVFRSENVSTSLAEAFELSDYCGLPPHELVAFRPERLIVHELLVRVTGGLAVPDGTTYEDLGRNFRAIASTVLDKYLAAHADALRQRFGQVREDAARLIAQELAHLVTPNRAPVDGEGTGRKWWSFAKAKRERQPPVESVEARERRLIREWSERAETAAGRLEQSCLRALNAVATAVTARRGRLFADPKPIADLALTLVGNDFGSEAIGDAMAPIIAHAARQEGYRPVPAQERPVILNVKGASASGKSTMRPLQQALANKLGFAWQNFALISPDIWRKFLLDYGSLGAAYKYAGTLTGHEIEIIDKKLDRHMAGKWARGEVSHLLIDRFRFDSFVEGREPKRLLTRFADLVYMFFIVTPPEMTVERAWLRGLQVGRYKAVEDLLAHNVEAYTGMPELFFTWALDARRRVHYEFLDNSVAEGRPLTIAFGWNTEMTIVDIKRMLDIDRFRKINIRAQDPDAVYAGLDLAPERNTDFLQRCARLIPAINFADRATARIYARLERGRWIWCDEQQLARVLIDADARAGLMALRVKERGASAAPPPDGVDRRIDTSHNLGALV